MGRWAGTSLRIALALAALAALAACKAEIPPAARDGGGGGDDGGGGGDGAGPDADLGPWMNATPIPTASAGGLGEDDLTLRFDELELIFAINPGTGGKDLYVMTRPDTASAWSMPSALTSLNTAGVSDQTPRLSPDGMTLYFGSPRTGGNGDDVWFSTRAGLGAPWSTPQLVPGVNSGGSDRWYGTCASGIRYVMISSRDGNLDLYEGAVGAAPQRIAELSSGDSDLSPLVSEDCLRLYFSSDRTGNYVIYYAERPAIPAPWQLVGPVDGLDTAEDEQDPWLSADQRRMYFSSNRDGDQDLYMATR